MPSGSLLNLGLCDFGKMPVDMLKTSLSFAFFANLPSRTPSQSFLSSKGKSEELSKCCVGVKDRASERERVESEEDAAHMSGRYWRSGKLRETGNVTMLLGRLWQC